jgi:signal transduction histidine kinase
MNDEALAQCQRQLAQVKNEFEEFIYLVSHDLNAPIRAISNLSGWIAEDLGENMPQDVLQNINLLQDRAQRLEKMLGAILLLSRVTRTDLDLAYIELSPFLDKIIQKYQPLQLTFSIGANVPGFTTYYKKLQTVLEELIANAIKHSEPEKVNINVAVSLVGQEVAFEVTDNGPGIPVEALDKVFSLFYTVKGKEGNENLGAGLTIARSIARFVGGNLTVNNSLEGKGTRLVLQWPITVV